MYIVKNAFRCIGRSMGRNVLIGIIALVIAVSACLGLSIRQAAESAKKSALAGMSVTATIQYDRAGAMGNMMGSRPGFGGGGSYPEFDFDSDAFAEMMGGGSSLTLDEYLLYASAESVQDFYYTLTAYFNGTDGLYPVTDESSDSSTDDSFSDLFPEGFGDMLATGDFSIIGYSSDTSMTAFVNGNAEIVEGSMFDEGTTELVCVISEELSMYNAISVGDSIVIVNPSLTTEVYTLTVKGIYSSSENNNFSGSMFGSSQDPANRIYMSANAVQAIIDASAQLADDTKVTANISATYTFADANAYYSFVDEVRELGLDDSYAVQSTDITEFENSMTPLNTLSKMAGWFLLVILIIGGIILVVLNIFNVRERKYEVGVLTAMGMKKWKVAAQFICEILVVTMVAVVIGAAIGAVSSVPVTNTLLAGQIESQSKQQTQLNQSFGRPGNMGGGFPGGMGDMPSDMPNFGGGNNFFGNMLGGAANYITEVDSAMNLTVVFQMLGVGLLLTLFASAASVLFIMRYDPLRILANRD